ncbi:MAG: hypothetical protein R2755_04035 [Acidimicrobiales bacterium]
MSAEQPPVPAAGGEAAPLAGAVLAGVERRPGVPKPDPILVADHLRRTFGGLVAVDVDHVESSGAASPR